MKTLLCLLLLTGLVLAQDLPCAPLLENLPSSSLRDVTSIDATFTIKYVEDGPDAQSTLRYAKDFVNDRAYLEHDVGDDLATYHYKNGVGTVTKDEKVEEAPAEEDLESIQEMMELLEFDLATIFARNGVQSCDGQQRYGDVLVGEQVTVSGNDERTSFVFDETGQLLGLRFYYDDAEGIPLTTFTDFMVKDGLLLHGITRFYELRGEEVVLLEERLLEVQSYNQPLDESLFTPTE